VLDKAGYVKGGHDGDNERSSIGHIYAIGDILQVCVTTILAVLIAVTNFN
jgi:thioredoxin reductase